MLSGELKILLDVTQAAVAYFGLTHQNAAVLVSASAFTAPLQLLRDTTSRCDLLLDQAALNSLQAVILVSAIGAPMIFQRTLEPSKRLG